ncbi:MAG: cell wall hydrolase [Novosphingobium sp.]
MLTVAWALSFALGLAFAGGVLLWNAGRSDHAGTPGYVVHLDWRQGFANGRAGARPPLPVPELPVLQPLSGQQAFAANETLPFSAEAVEVAAPFSLGSGPQALLSRDSAIDCLTAAIYYEAGFEGEQGQRAVAQVVLNRVRHPAFPSSVCEVVYQGSERRTGCQFTFTCDGSLKRKPAIGAWDRARQIAVQALDGKVEPSVGMATHYHANYVLPYWAPKLAKITAIGQHIFYRWSGFWGKRVAFSRSYTGERLQEPYIQAAGILDGEDSAPSYGSLLASRLERPVSGVLHSELSAGGASRLPIALRADEESGTLRLDDSRSRLVLDFDQAARRADP